MLLAQYTIRSKQDYIFKTNRVLEIMGASENVAKAWEMLFYTAGTESLKYKRAENGGSFQLEEIKKEFETGELDFIELFCGGGNETLLFGSECILREDGKKSPDNDSSFIKLNRAFSYKILKEYPGMIPMVVYTEATGDYSGDYRRLMEEAERKKSVMEPLWDLFTAPFAMMDRSTFRPYSAVLRIGNRDVRMSDESISKYWVGMNLRENNEDIRFFDEMITQKGKESLLAVVHADGNNMGAKIMDMLHNESNYDIAIPLMRKFTQTTADCFETQGEIALKECQNKLEHKYSRLIEEGRLKRSSLAYRRVIGSGDDATFICNARFVMDYVKAYLDSVQEYSALHHSDWKYSSCAGICIFHSHYPFSRAYSIAEQACDSAKEKVHVKGEEGSTLEQGWIDFHFIHSGISGELDEIRKNQGIDKCIARPWLLSFDQKEESGKDIYSYDDLLKLKKIFEDKGVSRSSIKTIGSAYERSKGAALKELISLYGHTPDLQNSIESIYQDSDIYLKALYDFAEIYDLWYSEVK